MPQLPAASSAIDRRRFLGVTAGTAAASALLSSTTARADTHHPSPSRFRRRRVRFGVNYVPSKNWWFSWSDWDRRSIAADLDDIASLGMDHIRIMLIWSELQPNATYVRGGKLKPIGETVRKLIAEFDRHPPQPPQRTTALVLPDDMIPVKDFSDLFDPFMKLIDAGTRPAVVLQSRTADPAYLAARGIKNLLPLS